MTLSTEALEQIEIDAWRDYCAAAPPVLAQAVGLETVECAGPLLSTCRRIDHYQFNRLIRFSAHHPIAMLQQLAGLPVDRQVGRMIPTKRRDLDHRVIGNDQRTKR